MYIEREIIKRFEKIEKVYPIVSLVGARQSGKTTFLKEQAKKYNFSYLLFDDPDVKNLFDEDIKKFEKQFLENSEISILDEVQYGKDAGTKLKYLADKGKRLWITSSSEMILSKNVLSYLVGRVSIIRLYPFSLNEFLIAKNQKSINQTMLERNIWEHAIYGGYPKVVITEGFELKKIILKDLYETMILKDITRTFSIEDITLLEELVKYISINVGDVVSYNNISRSINISFQTLKKYLDAMEKSYLIIKIKPFYRNKNKEITKQPKIYFLDGGLRNAVLNNFSSEIDGKTFENYVLSELVKRGFSPKYWRTKAGSEVDFVLEKEKEIVPIEIKTSIKGDRIERSLTSFIEQYKPRKAFVIFYKGIPMKKKIGYCEITFTNIFDLIDEIKGIDPREI